MIKKGFMLDHQTLCCPFWQAPWQSWPWRWWV